jgi:hypothetical protein
MYTFTPHTSSGAYWDRFVLPTLRVKNIANNAACSGFGEWEFL